MHTVKGVESTRPGQPHNIDQKIALASRASEDIPVRELKSHGSTKLDKVSSRRRNNPITPSGDDQPGDTATESANGSNIPKRVPTNGTIRIVPAITPQSVASGTCNKNNPLPNTNP